MTWMGCLPTKYLGVHCIMLRLARAAEALAPSTLSSARLQCLSIRPSMQSLVKKQTRGAYYSNRCSNPSLLRNRCPISQSFGQSLSERLHPKVILRLPAYKTAKQSPPGFTSTTTALVRRIHCRWRGPSLQWTGNSLLSRGISSTRSTYFFRGQGQYQAPKAAAVEKATCDTARIRNIKRRKQTPLQELLGITDAEVNTMQDKYQTTDPGLGERVKSIFRITSGVREEGAVAQNPDSHTSFVTFLLDDLLVEPGKMKALVLRNPRLLWKQASAVMKVSHWLQEDLGMDRSKVGRLLLRFPEAGQLSVEENLMPKAEWMRENLLTDNRGIVQLLGLSPQILSRNIQNCLEPRLKWLEHRLKIPKEKAARIGFNVPSVFVHSAEKKLEPTILWLQKRLKAKDESVVLAIVAAAPTVLGLNVETGLEPKLVWMRDSLGLNHTEICHMIRVYPSILVRSIEKSLQPKLVWLKEVLGLNKKEAKLMIIRHPVIMGVSIDGNLNLKLPWLQETMDLSLKKAQDLVKRRPTLLSLSMNKNIKPTVSFFREEMHASKEDLRIHLLQTPNLLMPSLNGRIRPRVAVMKEVKIKPLFSKHHEKIVLWPDAKFDAYIRNLKHEQRPRN